MPADVRSIDAVRDWYATLAAHGETLAEGVAGVELEIRRGFDWLADQLARWQQAVRDCEEEVVRAKAELSARKFPDFSGRMPDTTVQEKALRLARARLEHAEDQVVRVRAWIGRLPKLIDEVYRGAAHRLVGTLEVDVPRALAALNRRIGALESYAGLRPDYAPGPSTPAVSPAAQETGRIIHPPELGAAVMRFGTTRSQIYDAQKTARAKWDATADEWDDEVRREHGEKVVEPLDRVVGDTLRAIDQLAVLFTQIRNECEYPGHS